MPRSRALPVTRAWSVTCVLILLALASMLTSACAQGGPGDWAMVGHDPQHTGRSPYVGPDAPTEKWEFQTGQYFLASAAIGADGTLYVAAGDLYAINPDGTSRWIFKNGDQFNSTPAIGPDGTIYAAGAGEYLYAIGPEGSQKWAYQPGGYGIDSPTVANDGTIYVSANDQRLHAISPDGSHKWDFSTAVVSAPPAVSTNNTIYIGSDDCKLYALNADGTEQWDFQTQGAITASPAIASDGTIYVGSYDGNLYAINPDGSQKWALPVADTLYSTPSIAPDGTIYIGVSEPDEGLIYAVSPEGVKKWEFPTLQLNNPLTVDASGVVYAWAVNYTDNNLYAIGPDGSLKWSFSASGWAMFPPTIGSDGTLYIGEAGGTVCAIGPGQTPAAPYVSISEPSALSTTTGPITYTINYTDAASVTLSAADIHLNTSGTATGTVNVISSGDTSWTVTISDISGDGTIGISVGPGTASNSTGFALAAGPSETFDVDAPRLEPGDWSMCGHDSRHTGCSSYAGPPLPAELWSYDTNSYQLYHSCPALDSSGNIYIGGYGSIDAIRPAGAGGILSSLLPSVNAAVAFGPGGVIYATTDDGRFWAVSSKGRMLGRLTLGGYLTSPSIGLDGTIYVGSSLGTVYAIDPSCNEKWEFSTGEYVNGPPAIGLDGTVYVGSDDFNVYAINPDGSEKWHYTIGSWIESPAAVGPDGTVYIGAYDGYLYAIGSDGSLRWKFDAGSPIYDCPVLAPDGTICLDCQDKLFAITPDGSQKWAFTLNYDPATTMGQAATQAAVDCNGTIYFGNAAGRFYAVKPDGSRKWSLQQPFAIISTAFGPDGTLYIQSANGRLYAYGPDTSTIPPSITIDPPIPPYASMPAEYTVTYQNAADVSLSVEDIKLNTTGTAEGTVELGYVSPNVRKVYIRDVKGNGTIGISIAAGTAANAAGLAPAAGPSATFSVVCDPPTLAIGPPSAWSTRKGPVTYKITYSYAASVTLHAEDIRLICSGSARGTVSIAGSGNTTRTVTISHIAGRGTIRISVGSGTASNAAGYANQTGPSDEFEVVTGPPAVAIQGPWVDSPTGSQVLRYLVHYSGADSVTLSPSDIKLNKTGTANGRVSIDWDQRGDATVSISDMTGDGTLGISIPAGTAWNHSGKAPAAGPSQTFDVFDKPSSGVISPPSVAATRTGPVSYVVTFSHGSSVNLTAADISLNKTGTADGTITVDSVDSLTYRVTIFNITGDGTLGISVAAGVAGNPIGSSPAIGPSATTFAVISTPPGIQISAPSVPATQNGPVSYTVSYTDAASISLTAAKVHLRKTGSATGSISVSGSGTSSRTITISKIKGNGTLAISIAAGTAVNAAGSAPAAGPSQPFAVSSRP